VQNDGVATFISPAEQADCVWERSFGNSGQT
jgi:hypothetical protein